MIGQSPRGPGGPRKVVIVAVQAVSPGVVREGARVNRLRHATEGMVTQAHDPAEQQVAGRAKGGLSESRLQLLDERLQRQYHGPHGRTSCFLRSAITVRIGGTPCCFTPLRLPVECSS